MKKILSILFLISISLYSCSSSEETSTTSETETSNTTTTEAIINVVDLNNNPKEGYYVMLFFEQPTIDTPLPNIEMEVISDTNGLAKFNLNNIINGPKTIYIEAFTKEGDNYIWESITHPTKNMDIGVKWTTTIIVE